jgi:hypothetical protein
MVVTMISSWVYSVSIDIIEDFSFQFFHMKNFVIFSKNLTKIYQIYTRKTISPQNLQMFLLVYKMVYTQARAAFTTYLLTTTCLQVVIR